MSQDVLADIQNHLADYVVGIVVPVEGGGSRVLGSGVLVSIEGRRGLLTCGHVAQQYDKLPFIGLARFSAGTTQRRLVPISDAQRLILCSNDDWTDTDLDLAFTYFAPDIAGSVGAQSSFLNIENNRERIENGQSADAKGVDIIFGLVEEYSERPVIDNRQIVSPMRAAIYRGSMESEDRALVRFQTADDSPDILPRSFGGLSGSGLWRVHLVEHDGGRVSISEVRLWGIASYQVDKENNRGEVLGQGWDRIDQFLIPTVREKLPVWG